MASRALRYIHRGHIHTARERACCERTDVGGEIYNLFPPSPFLFRLGGRTKGGGFLSRSHLAATFSLFRSARVAPVTPPPSLYSLVRPHSAKRSPIFLVAAASPLPEFFTFPSIFAHSLMRHIASCAGGNDDQLNRTGHSRPRRARSRGGRRAEERSRVEGTLVKIMSWLIF